jgi:hypothetical protein
VSQFTDSSNSSSSFSVQVVNQREGDEGGAVGGGLLGLIGWGVGGWESEEQDPAGPGNDDEIARVLPTAFNQWDTALLEVRWVRRHSRREGEAVRCETQWERGRRSAPTEVECAGVAQALCDTAARVLHSMYAHEALAQSYSRRMFEELRLWESFVLAQRLAPLVGSTGNAPLPAMELMLMQEVRPWGSAPSPDAESRLWHTAVGKNANRNVPRVTIRNFCIAVGQRYQWTRVAAVIACV